MVFVASKIQWKDFQVERWFEQRKISDLDHLLKPYSIYDLYLDNNQLQQELFIEAMEILYNLFAQQEMLAAAAMSFLSHDKTLEQLRVLAIEHGYVHHIVQQYAHLQQVARKATNSLVFYKESMKKMLLAAVDDPRLIVVMLAEVLASLRHHHDYPAAKNQALAKLTLELFAPIAHRLGIGQIKWEMEDLAFYLLYRDEYYRLREKIAEKKIERQAYIDRIIKTIQDCLKEEEIQGTVSGRSKHFYSIWKKMNYKNKDLSQVYDLNALRVIVPSIQDCYKVLGLIHTKWRYLPVEFKDYIANPKINGYQSIHTAVFGPDQKIIELQIRTSQMHEHAEMGVAAHWMYKEHHGAKDYERKWQTLRTFIEHSENHQHEIFDQIKEEIFFDRIYIFTPKGDLFDLPKGATALDLAYHIHSDVGHHCCGAKTQGKMIALAEPLENGMIVEIMTSQRSQPSRDWLNPHYGYITTSRARQKVNHWFRSLDKNRHIQAGKIIFERIIKKTHHSQNIPWEKLLSSTYAKTREDFYHNLSLGEIKTQKVMDLLEPSVGVKKIPSHHKSLSDSSTTTPRVIFCDLGSQVQYNLASCCQPQKDDLILGLINRGRPIAVHKASCKSLFSLTNWFQRVVLARWSHQPPYYHYHLRFEVEKSWEEALIQKMTSALVQEKIFAFPSDYDRETGCYYWDIFSDTLLSHQKIKVMLEPFIPRQEQIEIFSD